MPDRMPECVPQNVMVGVSRSNDFHVGSILCSPVGRSTYSVFLSRSLSPAWVIVFVTWRRWAWAPTVANFSLFLRAPNQPIRQGFLRIFYLFRCIKWVLAACRCVSCFLCYLLRRKAPKRHWNVVKHSAKLTSWPSFDIPKESAQKHWGLTSCSEEIAVKKDAPWPNNAASSINNPIVFKIHAMYCSLAQFFCTCLACAHLTFPSRLVGVWM